MTKKLLLSILSLVLIASFFCAPASAKGVDAIDVNVENGTLNAAGDYGLNDIEYSIYCELKDFAKSVANGTVTNTKFVITTGLSSLTWTAEEIGCELGNILSNDALRRIKVKIGNVIDLSKVHTKLLYDLAYELYWYDKTEGITWEYSYESDTESVTVTKIEFSFVVSSDYSETGKKNTTATSPEKIAQASESINFANEIVEEYKNLSDLEKFNAYILTIMDLVEYNRTAADESTNTHYGNPWQIIWVFDNDSSTKVVCEAYSKAFKYLCDLSEFENEVECYLASGDNGSGPHMWNVVNINGANYLLDITLLDSVYKGQQMDFLWGGTTEDGGKSHSIYLDFLGYMAPTYVYTYSEHFENVYGPRYLELNKGNYHTEHTFSEHLHFNGFEHWSECHCGVKTNVEAHNNEGRVATCTEKAICSVCNIEYGKTAAHNYGEDGKCIACGQEKATEVIPGDNEQENKPENNEEDKKDTSEEEKTPSILDNMKERIENEQPANILEALIVLFIGIFEGIMKIFEIFVK